MGNATSFLDVDSCVEREKAVKASGGSQQARSRLSPVTPKPKSPKYFDAGRGGDEPERSLSSSSVPQATKWSADGPSPPTSPDGESTMLFGFKTSKDSFIAAVEQEKVRRVVTKRDQRVHSACKVPHNESGAFLDTFNRRPDIALRYGDVGGPNVTVEARRVRSRYEHKVKARMEQARLADLRRANTAAGASSTVAYNVPFTIAMR